MRDPQTQFLGEGWEEDFCRRWYGLAGQEIGSRGLGDEVPDSHSCGGRHSSNDFGDGVFHGRSQSVSSGRIYPFVSGYKLETIDFPKMF